MISLKIAILCTAITCASASVILELLNKHDASEMLMRLAYFFIVVDWVFWRLTIA